MPKKIKPESLIALELEKFEAKFSQFQQYLEQNNIVTQVTSDNQILLSEENQELLHKEIAMQIKIQDAIIQWLPVLEKLKEGDQAKKLETRGNVEIGGMFKKKFDDRSQA